MTIQLRRKTAKNIAAAGRLSGLLIEALRELGKKIVTPARRQHLERTIPADFTLRVGFLLAFSLSAVNNRVDLRRPGADP
jgi:hypothetical protein